MKKKSKSTKGFRQKLFGKDTRDSDDAKRVIARAMATSLCKGEGLELVWLEYQKESRGKVLRVYIDRLGKGIALDDCVNISRQLSDMLDVEWKDYSSYRLEVSSPGLEHTLGELSDFVRFNGAKVKVKLVNAFDGKKVFYGKILGVDGSMVRFCVDGKTITLKHDDIAQARLMVLNGDN